MQTVVEPALSRLAAGAWSIGWQAVRRRLNMAADAIAVEAAFWARRLRDQGVLSRRTRVRWLDVGAGRD